VLIRYLITLGAPTTADGKVTSASSFRSINGVKAALEGDKVWCPQCNSEGVIALDGPRLSETCNGRQQALNDDLCLCKCNPSPRLLTAQTFACQKVDADWHAAKAAARAETAAKLNTVESSATETDSIPILLRLSAECRAKTGVTSWFSRDKYAKLWVVEQRMKFVLGAAEQFNKLLNGPERPRVEKSIRAIAAGGGVA
jgi:uncharacterized Zn-binding protein involved in type VI secretion